MLRPPTSELLRNLSNKKTAHITAGSFYITSHFLIISFSHFLIS
ncbi:hypothetical protein HMPREF9072_01546 [Capnocytophaga sp. oral taxon 324 str. F0483]|nr:hypothetical protein HMPREF9072_01546 [Capnocytophaga sp. oral taxon 324 str. F0483]